MTLGRRRAKKLVDCSLTSRSRMNFMALGFGVG